VAVFVANYYLLPILADLSFTAIQFYVHGAPEILNCHLQSVPVRSFPTCHLQTFFLNPSNLLLGCHIPLGFFLFENKG